jgi:dTDP-4-dehydrorhamnose reductase
VACGDPLQVTQRPAPSDVYGNSKWMAERGLADIAEDNFTSHAAAPFGLTAQQQGEIFPRS